VRRIASDIVVPTALLAEGVLTGHVGRDYHIRRLLDVVGDIEIDRGLGLAAGVLRQQSLASGVTPSGVDALVAAVADRLTIVGEVLVVTSDPEDLGALTSFADRPERISLLAV
jgi:hypothetical protein